MSTVSPVRGPSMLGTGRETGRGRETVAAADSSSTNSWSNAWEGETQTRCATSGNNKDIDVSDSEMNY